MGQIQTNQRHYDASLVLETGGSGAKTASFTADVAFLDIGTGRVEQEVALDVDAIDATTGDESYRAVLVGSTDSGFSTGEEEELGSMTLGGAGAKLGDQVDVIGRHFFDFSNVRSGKVYRYVRLQFVLAGTSPSITLGEAFITPKH